MKYVSLLLQIGIEKGFLDEKNRNRLILYLYQNKSSFPDLQHKNKSWFNNLLNYHCIYIVIMKQKIILY